MQQKQNRRVAEEGQRISERRESEWSHKSCVFSMLSNILIQAFSMCFFTYTIVIMFLMFVMLWCFLCFLDGPHWHHVESVKFLLQRRASPSLASSSLPPPENMVHTKPTFCQISIPARTHDSLNIRDSLNIMNRKSINVAPKSVLEAVLDVSWSF